MSVDFPPETETETETDAEEGLDALAGQLGEGIAQLPEYRRFVEAKERVEDSETAQEKIREFEEVRREFMLARQTGEASQADVRELQAAQEALHDVPAMADYLAAQSELEDRLRELDERISESLAIDFGETASACCQE